MLKQPSKLYSTLQKRYSRRINLNLSRIKKVLLKLDNPHLEVINPINILGSDGKMSVLTSLKYFIEADKKKVNTFTSPHLFDLRHRFWLENKFISIKKIIKLTNIIEKTNLKLTLFELLTCIFILAAKELKNISYNLIESGLLFKKDSTNLWANPKAQIVTNINFQHQDWVRPKTIKEICIQKVGSLSKNTTIYVAPQSKKTLKIIKNILKKNPSKKVYSNTWCLKKNKGNFFYKDKKNIIPIKSKFINSDALISNLCLAIKVALDLGVKKKIIIKTIPKIKFEGRVQYIKKGKLRKLLNKNEKILIDGCHSKESAKNLYNYLKTINGPIYGIWGMQKNKLPDAFIESFNLIFKKLNTVTIPNEPNSIKASVLKSIGLKFGYNTQAFSSVENAVKKISDKRKKTIVIFGSLYLVGNILSKN
jgi:dihydrofolate synthase/folylpolyglutamate synthase